ncbi:MAG TPA: hypothetical protein VJ742_07065 [Nitrososphaera sp.]|jgi:hypothetical protein|nr:hypothetical protein [Nitrososphaera sp.]
MEFKFQKRRGIGNVITTLIILIASVVLGAGVIFFGGSMFQTNTQSESIKISNVHSWVDNANLGTTAFVVQNTGSKAVTINSISLRGVSVPTSAWWYSINANQTTLQTELQASDMTVAHVESNVSIGGTPTAMTNGSISLAQGQAAIVFLDEAGSIDAIDAGNTYSLQIQAGQATAVQQVQVVTG